MFSTFFIKVIKTIKNIFRFYIFPQKGTFTDTGDGDGGGEQITNNHNESQKTVRTKIVHTSGHFPKMSKHIQNIFIYTENDT